ncbi:MAG: chromate transporter [Actinomycetia bacterium]|nr:chromate transporter [Actinomycetes bacterium]
MKKTRLDLFLIFLKIGAFTFGGGFAMIPLIEREVVEKKCWIDYEDMCDILAISQSFPGAVAINSATIVGYRVAGYWGSVLATLGVVLPSFAIMTLVAAFFTYFINLGAVQAALKGIGACVVALLIVAAIRVGKSAMKGIISVVISVAALALILWLDIHPIYTIIMGLALGLAVYGINVIKRKKR